MKKNHQTKLDAEMVELGKERYQRKVRKAKDMGIESTTAVGQRLLGEAIGVLSEAIEEWMEVAAKAPGRRHRAYPFLAELPTDVVAGLTARTVLDAISIERKITSTATAIGRILEDEYKFRVLRRDEPALWQQMNRVLGKTKSSKTRAKFINNSMRFHKLVLAQWDLKDATAVGLTVIELMRQSTGLIDIKTRTDIRGKSYTYIQPTDDVMKWMKDSHEYNEILNPVWLPMVEKPVDWNNPYIGGYPATNHRRRPLIKTADSGYLEELAETDLTDMYSAFNTVQSTKYIVDSPLLAIIKVCWERGLAIGGLPSMEDERIPNKPADIGTNEESRRRWRKSAARIHFENDRMKSKRLQAMKVIQLADKFIDDILRFPHTIDFRARGYPVPPYLNMQGPEYASSILSFHQGKKLSDTGVKWLYRHVASMWGLDKKTFEERSEWTESNMEMILRIGSDPLADMTWADADKPWKFLKACMEIFNMKEQGQENFISHIPLGADAVNQGLQLYSILGRDQKGGKATNVVPTLKPEDVYDSVAKIVERKLYEDNDEYGAKWLAFGINRNTTKRQTMTVVYSSTFYSCRAYTAEWFYGELKKGKENPFGEETYRPCNYLAEKIWEAISEVVSAARLIMDWIRECAVICLDNDVVPRWFTPLGFPVKMNYEKTDKYSVKTLVSGTLRQHRLRIPNGEVNRRRILNAICPNFIHSLDGFGGLLGGVVLECLSKGIVSFSPTHDEYEVLAEDMEILHHSIRTVSVEIFSVDILKNLRDELTYLLPVGTLLPETPLLGSLDIMDILKSKYYFN
jgi:DNA-directed RNA polymerase, mitochondrial